jgi:7-cyano-7-deazaguanine synthase
VTYVPARNTLFLALALGLAEARGADAIVIGANAVDFSGYPDCRPEFLAAFAKVAEAGTKAGVEGRAPRLLAPLVDLSKADIVRLGRRLGVPFEHTLSCYDPGPSGEPCGACDACRLRRKGFGEAREQDPADPRT